MLSLYAFVFSVTGTTHLQLFKCCHSPPPSPPPPPTSMLAPQPVSFYWRGVSPSSFSRGNLPLNSRGQLTAQFQGQPTAQFHRGDYFPASGATLAFLQGKPELRSGKRSSLSITFRGTALTVVPGAKRIYFQEEACTPEGRGEQHSFQRQSRIYRVSWASRS